MTRWFTYAAIWMAVLSAHHVYGHTLGTLVVESIRPAALSSGFRHGLNVRTRDEPVLPASGAVFRGHGVVHAVIDGGAHIDRLVALTRHLRGNLLPR